MSKNTNKKIDQEKAIIGVRGKVLKEETKDGVRIIKDIKVLGFDILIKY